MRLLMNFLVHCLLHCFSKARLLSSLSEAFSSAPFCDSLSQWDWHANYASKMKRESEVVRA